MRKKLETELLRNNLCVRWTDDDHKRLTDFCWTRRIPSCSEFVRNCVKEQMDREEVTAEPKQAV